MILSCRVAILIGAAAVMTSCSSPSSPQTAGQPTGASVSLKNVHRTYNPLTGNYDEAAPWGPRSDH